MARYYITTTAPYVNAEAHIGFALEIIQADVLARYHQLIGDEVMFGMGTDEHGKKIYEKAIENNQTPQAYTDEYAAKFENLKTALNLSYNLFTRTTDTHHIEAAQEMWRRCARNGYIEKGIYRAKYCVGCELEKTDSELVEGKCPIHPNYEIETIEEENYFFKFSDPRIQEGLLKYYDEHPDFVVPPHRQKEIRNFVEGGLSDFSISRLAAKMPWGVPVPDDPAHVMYVWFDALTFYLSAIGFPDRLQIMEDFWGTKGAPRGIQVAGKDNLRQQAAMWQAMLIASQLPPTKQILIHGFITSGGAKMSKSLGNVVNPLEYVEKYGIDPLRYYLLAKMSPFEDSDFTKEKFEAAYTSDLQNGLGNLVSRVATMAAGMEVPSSSSLPAQAGFKLQVDKKVAERIEKYRFDEAVAAIWEKVNNCNTRISEKELWKLTGEERARELGYHIGELRQIAVDLASMMPETAEKISAVFAGKIQKTTPLFPRL